MRLNCAHQFLRNSCVSWLHVYDFFEISSFPSHLKATTNFLVFLGISFFICKGRSQNKGFHTRMRIMCTISSKFMRFHASKISLDILRAPACLLKIKQDTTSNVNTKCVFLLLQQLRHTNRVLRASHGLLLQMCVSVAVGGLSLVSATETHY